MTTARVEMPEKLIPIFAAPRGSVQYRGAYGGRSSAKSFTFAKAAAMFGYAEDLRILCTREFQSSIKDSFHAELKAAIASEPWLADHYDVGIDYIRGINGTEFMFSGLRRSISSIKSKAKIDITIVEEAEDVPESSWIDLEPTVLRTPKSELWVIWNPKQEGSAADKRFKKDPPKNSRITEINYKDNPFNPEGMETLRKRDLARLDSAMYAHIWEGQYLKNSESQVFSHKFRVEDFTPQKDWDGPYHGIDFGFSQDPTTAVKCWIDNERLYIEYDVSRVGLELDDTADYLMEAVPDIANHTARADCARPESISYLKRNGLPRIVGCKKGAGSVEDGIEFMKSFREIVIHTRCKETISEFNMYSYKIDKLSGDILPIIVDAYNHLIDAIRYALEPVMRRSGQPNIRAL